MKYNIIQVSLSALVATLLFVVPVSAQPQPPVRPTVGEPLLEAVKLAGAGDYENATAKIDQADAVSDKTPPEVDMIGMVKRYVEERSTPLTTGYPVFGSP
jgi:hypothetical protein